MILWSLPSKGQILLLKGEKSYFQWKNHLHTKGKLLNSKNSHLMLLKRLFWATNEDDLLGFTENLSLVVKALPQQCYFTPQSLQRAHWKEKPWESQQSFAGCFGISVDLPRDGVATPRGSCWVGNVGHSQVERCSKKWGTGSSEWGGFAESSWSGCKLLVCLPKAALLWLLVCLGLC